MYDIVFISNNEANENKNWELLKSRFPTAKFAQSLHNAAKKCFTRFFWIVYDDIIINEDFDFSYVPDKGSQNIVHVFQNGIHYDGICLIPKNNLPSEREFYNRYFIEKKEVEILASYPEQYDFFDIADYDSYLKAIEKSKTNFFWFVPNDVNSDYNFDYQAAKWEKYTHVFLNKKYYDGICLFTKDNLISKKEFDHRFFMKKKEVDIDASSPVPFDIVFISYQESNAEENYNHLLKIAPTAKRINNVKGIHKAHIEAAKIVNTEMFWVVDGDALIENNFSFNYQVPKWQQDTVHVWHSKNPVNDLTYGYGGVKLLPTNLTCNMDTSKTDMTTSISNKFKAVPELSNITAFNTDSFSAWRSGFRECVKLASQTIDRQLDSETLERLEIWCNQGTNRPFGIDTIKGAIAGRRFGEENKDNPNELQKINDFEWLEETFRSNH